MRRTIPAFTFCASTFCIGLILAALLFAQTPAGLNLTATTANVSGAPDSVRIEILRWSTDEERDKLMSAWEMKAPPAGAASARGGVRGGAKGGGKGAAAAGGRGRGGAGGGSTAAPATPESSLAGALQGAATVGYVWSSEAAGYALRYAGRFAGPNGSQRIVLLTERRLGAANQRWNSITPGDPNSYEFSLIELRLNPKGEGEGKASVTGKIAPDPAADIVALENYDAQPTVFRDVKEQAERP